MQWLMCGEWGCPLENAPKLAMGQRNRNLKKNEVSASICLCIPLPSHILWIYLLGTDESNAHRNYVPYLESVTDASERSPFRKIMKNCNCWNIYCYYCFYIKFLVTFCVSTFSLSCLYFRFWKWNFHQEEIHISLWYLTSNLR